jgi:hypothetical protein
MVFNAQTMNNPQSVEFTELVPAANTTMRNEFQAEKHKENNEATEETFETTGADGSYTAGERKSTNANRKSAEVSGFQEVSNVTGADGRTTLTSTSQMSKSTKQQSSSSTSSTTRTFTTSSASSGVPSITAPPPALAAPPRISAPPSVSSSESSHVEPLAVNPRRSLINPKFILTVLKGVTHRFLLSMESETRLVDKKAKSPRGGPVDQSPVTKFPPRFSVGGPRASKDPRTTPIDDLIEITSAKPEIQLPPGKCAIYDPGLVYPFYRLIKRYVSLVVLCS